jgi:ubiquinone/menaquinone biosynthesis C-methylase UbiE
MYVGMERCFAGPLMQRCRIAHLDAVRGAESILLVGEGPGRFLRAVLKTNSVAQCHYVDGSGSMLHEARRVVERMNAPARVVMEQRDLMQWTPEKESADVLTTHFFLDCFTDIQLEALIPRLAQTLKPAGAWIVSDFKVPSGAFRLPAKVLLKLLYAFFRRATGIAADRLIDPEPYLRREGFILEKQRRFLGGVLQSDLWRRAS